MWYSMDALVHGASTFLDFDTLKPLFIYMKSIPICMHDATSDLSFGDLKAEYPIFKRVLSSLDSKSFQNRKEIDISMLTTYMLKNYRDVAPILCNLYLIAITAGFASARVECPFPL